MNDQRSKQGFDVIAGSANTLVGWAVNADKAAPKQAMFVLRGTTSYGLTSSMGGRRSDVAEALHSTSATNSGFHVDTQLQGVAPGRYHAFIEVSQPNGPPTLCNLHRYIQVAG